MGAILDQTSVVPGTRLAEASGRDKSGGLDVPCGVNTLVAVASLLAAGVLWRARPAAGRGRAIPPGSLGLLASLRALSDPHFYENCARRWGPVFKMAQFHRPVVCVTDLPLGLRLLHDRESDLVAPRLPFGRVPMGDHIAFVHDRDHPRHRAVLTDVLTVTSAEEALTAGKASGASIVAEAASHTAAALRRGLEDLADADRGEGVQPDDALTRMTFSALLRVVAGAAPTRTEADDLVARFMVLGRPGTGPYVRPEERSEHFEPLIDWVAGRAERVRERLESGSGSPDSVLGAVLALDRSALEDRVLFGNLLLFVLVTSTNVRGTLAWVLKEALDNPAYVEAIGTAARGPDRAEAATLTRHFVNEVLRLHQSEFFYRETARPTRIADFRIPAGWLVRICVREAHRDPSVFDHPDEFRPERFAARRYDEALYRPFSDGSHSRFGEHAARMIAGEFLRELSTGFRARALRDGPPERGVRRHWSHWRPSRQWRVAVERV